MKESIFRNTLATSYYSYRPNFYHTLITSSLRCDFFKLVPVGYPTLHSLTPQPFIIVKVGTQLHRAEFQSSLFKIKFIYMTPCLRNCKYGSPHIDTAIPSADVAFNSCAPSCMLRGPYVQCKAYYYFQDDVTNNGETPDARCPKHAVDTASINKSMLRASCIPPIRTSANRNEKRLMRKV